MKLVYRIQNKETAHIWIENNILLRIGQILEKENHSAYLLLCDPTTKKLFSEIIINSLSSLKIPVKVCQIPEGEKNKNTSILLQIIDELAQAKFDRKSAIIALGGGVIGDLATTAAALYNRGIDCIQIPTTLLSQVDASLGGKGAVNMKTYKNAIGIVKQPKYTLIDTSLIKHLPLSQYKSGMAEVIKYALALDEKLFNILAKKNKLTDSTMVKIIERCVQLKMNLVKKDPYDNLGKRAVLNFGHTLGHAIELITNISHGEAVSIGMVFSIRVSQKMGLLKTEDAKRAIQLIKSYNLPLKAPIVSIKDVYINMQKDKKAVSGLPMFILISGIGKAVNVQSVPKKILDETLKEIIA